MLLNELYIGNSKYTERLENAISKYRKAFIGKSLRASAINNSAEADYLNRVIENMFGYNAFNLLVEVSDTINACTITTVYRSSKLKKDTKKYIKFDKERIYFDKALNMDTICIFYTSLIFNEEFTDREITGILLHEIGHNFEYTMNDPLGMHTTLNALELMCMPYKIIKDLNHDGPDDVIIDNCKKMFITSVQYQKQTNPGGFESLDTVVKNLANSDIARGIQGAIASFKKSKVGKFLFKFSDDYNKQRRKTDFDPYAREVLADEFASMFGYGVDLASGLNKLEKASMKKKTINRIPIIGFLADFASIPITILVYSFDEHPVNVIRMKKQIEYLEKELDGKDLSPKMKKDIKLQIEKINEVIDDSLDFNMDDIMYNNVCTKLLKTMYFCLCSTDDRYVSVEGIESEFDALKKESKGGKR